MMVIYTSHSQTRQLPHRTPSEQLYTAPCPELHVRIPSMSLYHTMLPRLPLVGPPISSRKHLVVEPLERGSHTFAVLV